MDLDDRQGVANLHLDAAPLVELERRQGQLDDSLDREPAPGGRDVERPIDLLQHVSVRDPDPHRGEGRRGRGVGRRPEERRTRVGEGGVTDDRVGPARRAHPQPDGAEELGRLLDHDRGEPQESPREPLVREPHAADEEIGPAHDVGPNEGREGPPNRSCRSVGGRLAGREGGTGVRQPTGRWRDGGRSRSEREQSAERLAKLPISVEHRSELDAERVAGVERPRRQAAAVGPPEEVDEPQPPILCFMRRPDPGGHQEINRLLDLVYELRVADRVVGIRRRRDESFKLVGDAVEDVEPEDPEHHAGRVIESRSDVGQPAGQARV
jgi:hypothetical protein